MATTTKGVPYPLGTDNNEAQLWFQDLAEWVDDALGGKTAAQITALSGADLWAGRMVYETDSGDWKYYDGAGWNTLGIPVGSIIWAADDGSSHDGYLLAVGGTVSQATYANLYARLGNAHGAAGGGNFYLPDLQGRTVCGFASGQTEFNVQGEKGGAKTVTLATGNMPSHSHTGPSHSHNMSHDHSNVVVTGGNHTHTYENRDFASSGTAAGYGNGDKDTDVETTGGTGSHSHTVNTPAYSGTTLNSGTGNTGNTGSGNAFSILQPYITLRAYIKY